MDQNKLHLNLVIIGHCQVGKSMIAGHLVYNCGGLSQRQIDRLQKSAEHLDSDKKSFKYAWIMDSLWQNKNNYMSVQYSTLSKVIYTLKYNLTIYDVPGYRRFIKTVIRGVSQADCALLVVSAQQNEFMTGLSENGQTKQHAIIAVALGVKQLIVVINKMDLIQFEEQVYQKRVKSVSECLNKIGSKFKKVTFIPISAWTVDNIKQKTDKLGWYKDPTLIEALDLISQPQKYSKKPLRIPIRDVVKISGLGTVVLGRVSTGCIRPDMDLAFCLSAKTAKSRTIQINTNNIQKATSGNNVGIHVLFLHRHSIKKGDVIGDLNDDPPRQTLSFIAQIIIIAHPNGIEQGYTPVIHCHKSRVPCRFKSIKAKINKKSGDAIEQNPSIIRKNDCALVLLEPLRPFCCEVFSQYSDLGRIIITDSGRVVGVGVIKEVQKKEI